MILAQRIVETLYRVILSKMKNSKLKNVTQIYFIGVITRIAFLTGALSLFYGMFIAPIFLVSDYVIMGVVLIGAGIYLNKVFKQKSKNKKSLWWV